MATMTVKIPQMVSMIGGKQDNNNNHALSSLSLFNKFRALISKSAWVIRRVTQRSGGLSSPSMFEAI